MQTAIVITQGLASEVMVEVNVPVLIHYAINISAGNGIVRAFVVVSVENIITVLLLIEKTDLGNLLFV